MCRCEQPTINGDRGSHVLIAPELADGDELLIDAPGRCGTPPGCDRGIDCHAYHHRLVQNGCRYYLITRHGAGEERHQISYGTAAGIPSIIAAPEGAHYWLLHTIYTAARMASESASNATAARWATAAANGRIKTRKVRGTNNVKVSVAPAVDDRLCFSL